MIQKAFLVLLVIVLMLSGVTVLSVSAQTGWVCPEGFEGQTLRVFNWANYVAENTISGFEEACGVTVEYFEYGTNDELLTILQVGTANYDVVVPTVDLVPSLADQNLIQPLDHSRIPNIGNIGPIINDLPIDEGHQFSIPYQWNTIGIAYDQIVVETPITSWEDFFAYDGRVAWMDDSRLLLSVALYELGYPFSSTDPTQIEEAAQYLLEVPNSDVFTITGTAQADLMFQGEVDAVVALSRSIVPIIEECACEDFVYVFPEDIFIASYDALAIPANAENPELAHAFLDYVLDPQVSADISSALGSSTPVRSARPLVDESVLNNGISYPADEVVLQFLNEVLVLEDVGQAVSIYVEQWNQVKAELAGN